MARKSNLEFAICRDYCDKCHEEAWLYIPTSNYYGLLCGKCMNECKLEIDMKATSKNLGSKGGIEWQTIEAGCTE